MAKIKTIDASKYPTKTVYQVSSLSGDCGDYDFYSTLTDARRAAKVLLKRYDGARIYKIIHVEEISSGS